MDDEGVFAFRRRDVAMASGQDLGVFKAFHPTLDGDSDMIPKSDNEALYYLISGTVVFEFVFETLPQIIIQTINNFKIRSEYKLKAAAHFDEITGVWDMPLGETPPEKGWPTFAIVSILVSMVVAFDSLYRQLIQVVCLKKEFGSFDIWSRGDVKTDVRDSEVRRVDEKLNSLRSFRKSSWHEYMNEKSSKEESKMRDRNERASMKERGKKEKEAQKAKERKEKEEKRKEKQEKEKQEKERQRKLSASKRTVANPAYDGNDGYLEVQPDSKKVIDYQPVSEGFGEDIYDTADDDDLYCASGSVTGKECTKLKAKKSEFCKKHTCSKKGCKRLKSSKAEFCKKHKV